MILLKKLTIKDFLSHSDTVVEFNENDKVLLDGPSGAGKSSIFDALIWTLFGEGRSDNRNLIRKGQKMTSVTLDLLRGEETVSITRTATATGKHTLVVSFISPTGERTPHTLTGLRPLQEWIDKELIGASYLLFVNSVAYIQGNNESFVSQTAPKRKELLLEIVKAEDYKVLYESARKKLSELDSDRSKAEGQSLELAGRMGALEASVETRSSQTKLLAEHEKVVNDTLPEIKDLEDRKAIISADIQTSDLLSRVLLTTVADRDTLKTSLERKLEKIKDKDLLLQKQKTIPTYVNAIEETKGELHTLRTDLSSVSEQDAIRQECKNRKPQVIDRSTDIDIYRANIKTLEEKPVCPSGTSCPYSGDHSKQKKLYEAQINNLQTLTAREAIAVAAWSTEMSLLPPQGDIRVIMAKITEVEKSLRSLETELATVQQVKGEIDIIEAIEVEIPELYKQLADKNQAIKDIEEKRKNVDNFAQTELKTIESRLTVHKETVRVSSSIVASCTANLALIDKNEKELEVIEGRLADLTAEVNSSQDKARKIGLVKDAFGEKGLKTLVLDILIPRLEEKINEFLSQMSDFRIRLDTQRTSADGESMIEGLYIFVSNEVGEEMDLANYSGGEKLRISIAVTEGVASLSKTIGFRLMDEAIFGLSPEMVQDFSLVLSKLQTRYPQILAISHVPEVKDIFDKTLTVCKTNGISYVKS